MRALRLVFIVTATLGRPLAAQWEALNAGTTSSLRGLSVVSSQVVWASGSRGSVIHTSDGGNRWTVDTIPGASTFEVRAVAAMDDHVAHVASTNGRIWRTTDGGATWSLRFQASDTTMFLDAIRFADARHGVVLGDPSAGRFVVLRTDDGGETWREAPAAERPIASDGEAAFAASGSSLVVTGGTWWIGSGGGAARVHRSEDGRRWQVAESTLQAGDRSNGVFALAFLGARGVAVGGNYRQPDSTRASAAYSIDGGATWTPAETMPSGFRSGAALLRAGDRIVALSVGTNGTDVSLDAGRTWRRVDGTNLNAVGIAANGMAFGVGPNGRVVRMDARALIN